MTIFAAGLVDTSVAALTGATGRRHERRKTPRVKGSYANEPPITTPGNAVSSEKIIISVPAWHHDESRNIFSRP